MRCARCDRIALPEVLGRAPDGSLVFGWCRGCLDESGCVAVEVAPARLASPEREPVARRVRRRLRAIRRAVRRPRSIDASRRLAALGLAGLMAAWALILAFLGGFRLIAQHDPKGPFFLFGAGMMAIVSLVIWASILGRSTGPAVAVKVARVAAIVAAAAALLWWVTRND